MNVRRGEREEERAGKGKGRSHDFQEVKSNRKIECMCNCVGFEFTWSSNSIVYETVRFGSNMPISPVSP